MLLFTGAHFLAVLEGEEWDLSVLWLRLEQDQRHCDLFRIGDDLCGKRMYSEWMMAYMVDFKVDAQIESLRSLRGRFDMGGARAGTQTDTFRSLQTRSTPMWAEIIQPIMLRADSM